MAKSNKDSDRREVVERMRRERQRAERRRTLIVVAVCAVVALVIVGLGAYPLIRQSRIASGSLATLGATRGEAGCQERQTKPAQGNQDHQPEGTDIVYPEAPPAFGAHYAVTAPFSRKFYTAADRPRIEYLVHNLEHGYTLLWYDETVADDADQLAVVKAIAAKFEGQRLTDKFIALPWTAPDGKAFPDGKHVALTHWSAGGGPEDRRQAGRSVAVLRQAERRGGHLVREGLPLLGLAGAAVDVTHALTSPRHTRRGLRAAAPSRPRRRHRRRPSRPAGARRARPGLAARPPSRRPELRARRPSPASAHCPRPLPPRRPSPPVHTLDPPLTEAAGCTLAPGCTVASPAGERSAWLETTPRTRSAEAATKDAGVPTSRQ